MSPDVVVVGSGVIGSFTALELHRTGLHVTVVDRDGLAPGTSRASDGNILVSDHGPGPVLDFARRSRRLWRERIDDLGNDCEYDAKGSLVVAMDEAAAAGLAAHVEAHRSLGLEAAYLSEGFQALEPMLSPAAHGCGFWAGDAQVQPMKACYQIARYLKASGVAYELYDPLVRLSETADAVRLELASGATIEAATVVLCTGVWTADVLAPLGLALPLRSRKGQIAVLERGPVEVRRKISDFAYNATVEQASEDGVQTAAIIEATQSGTILCGSSRTFAGLDRSVDPLVTARILADCLRLVPALGELRMIRAYAGLRPWSPDGMPMIGAIGERGRVLVATGHEGAGHGLAAATGELVAALLGGGRDAEQQTFIEAFDPRRFAA